MPIPQFELDLVKLTTFWVEKFTLTHISMRRVRWRHPLPEDEGGARELEDGHERDPGVVQQ